MSSLSNESDFVKTFSKSLSKKSKLSKSKLSKLSNLSKTPSKTLLKKALKTGKGFYANKLVYYLAISIISKQTTIETALVVLLPEEIAYTMIFMIRKWEDYTVYTERVLLDKVVLPFVVNLKNVTFLLPKIKFSYIESLVYIVAKLLVVIAILKEVRPSYIKKLRKDLKI